MNHSRGQRKIIDWTYDNDWRKFWYRGTVSDTYIPFTTESHSDSKFIMEINMNTTIKDLKKYCKTNGIKGFSKINNGNKSEWITKIYNQE